MAESEACARPRLLAAFEDSSSWSLGEYAVSVRSDLRSAATSILALLIWILGEDAASSRSSLRFAANYTKAPVRSETEAKPWRSQ